MRTRGAAGTPSRWVAAACPTSARVITPPGPVPRTVPRSTPAVAASLRTRGERTAGWRGAARVWFRTSVRGLLAAASARVEAPAVVGAQAPAGALGAPAVAWAPAGVSAVAGAPVGVRAWAGAVGGALAASEAGSVPGHRSSRAACRQPPVPRVSRAAVVRRRTRSIRRRWPLCRCPRRPPHHLGTPAARARPTIRPRSRNPYPLPTTASRTHPLQLIIDESTWRHACADSGIVLPGMWRSSP
jgi:hypothetical protein